ncbi:NADP-dependent oxidoreductase [Glycomyces sp. NPDC048151]|uniref:NADP-dependent oxidoreductase n=1 Tax=Glycomyces sp. NPDC048151 TaxID=3364002 RepID=UPI003722BAA3
MQAVRFHSYGGNEVLTLETIKEPTPGPLEVVVKVAGTSFNPLDAAIRTGILREFMPVELPFTPGVDVAGTVTALGEHVTGWNIGDAVIAYLSPPANGAAAEYAAVPAALLASAPKTVPLADAAALPAVGLTAHQALFEHLDLQAGERILINGAGGGVGGYAVQLANRAGASVTATASPRSTERVRSYGPDRIIDHTERAVTEALAGERFDKVLQLVRSTPEETAALAALTADGGVFASATTPGPQDLGRGVRMEQVYVRSDAKRLTDLVTLVDAGELRIDVAERLPLDALAAVHDRAFAGGLLGKTVLIP